MDFLRARTEEQIEQRRLDILQSCDALFEAGGYENVNIKAISEMTTITRSSIYTYYKTKDEMLMDLLIMELVRWKEELLAWCEATAPLTCEEFARQFTDILAHHDKMLQYYCLLYTLLEKNCRIEKMVAFKKQAIPVAEAIVQIILKNFPVLTIQSASEISEQIIAFLLGLYPSSHLTPKQKEAILLSQTEYQPPEFHGTCAKGIEAFLLRYLHSGNSPRLLSGE